MLLFVLRFLYWSFRQLTTKNLGESVHAVWFLHLLLLYFRLVHWQHLKLDAPDGEAFNVLLPFLLSVQHIDIVIFDATGKQEHQIL